MTAIRILRAGPLTTIQDLGRHGYLRHGVGASGPMDQAAFVRAGGRLGGAAAAGIEFTAPFAFAAEEQAVSVALDGADFTLTVNGREAAYPAHLPLSPGDTVSLVPGAWGNFGYLRFNREVQLAPTIGSWSTNLVVGLGGLEGRALRPGDCIALGAPLPNAPASRPSAIPRPTDEPIRFIWGIHADLFAPAVRHAFVDTVFGVSASFDRMGMRLEDRAKVFTPPGLSLVSDAIVAGDIQILGDGAPIVLLRDHQPTGGYPRIGTVITADLDRLVQMRPGAVIRFQPITVTKAQAFLKEAR